ncbi:MAG TPA: L-threonylcarbamoyladenylate synthase [Chitinophagaceae bacterium]|nr:L-threonylcarbamoyladenylate synthase [Chitinophagaceae bacterium]
MMDFQHDLEQCLKVLEEGGLILYPTDTIWGIGCDATNSAAVQKVYALKQRHDEKALIILVAEERDVLKYVAGADLAVFDYLQQANKPTTVIYDGAIGLADNLTGKDGSIGIRICQEPFCRHLIKRFRKPIVSTSANISGEPSPGSFGAVSLAIQNGVDYVVQYRQDDVKPAVPSSIIRWEKGAPVIIRP